MYCACWSSKLAGWAAATYQLKRKIEKENDEEKSKVSDVNGEVTKIIRAQAGSKSALTNNFIHPLNSSDKLRTFDGKKEFDFQLAGCEASKSFLEMNTQPQPNGKIRILTIKQDSTMDGNFDYLVQPNLDVDLVCANGFSTPCCIALFKGLAPNMGSNPAAEIGERASSFIVKVSSC